jgi:hypothetical protein
VAKHSVLEHEDELGELDYGYLLPPETGTLARVLCYIFIYSMAALGLWCAYLYIFGA